MPVSTPKYKNLFCQTLKKQVLIRGFLLYSKRLAKFEEYFKNKPEAETEKTIVLCVGNL